MRDPIFLPTTGKLPHKKPKDVIFRLTTIAKKPFDLGFAQE